MKLDIVNTLELLQIHMHFETKTIQYYHKLEKTKSLLFTVFWEKKYIAKKWTHTFHKTFVLFWMRDWCKQRDEKKILCLKKLLVKTIIVLTSIYSGSYCKIPSRSNKSILLSFCHKIYLHVKGILNQNKQI